MALTIQRESQVAVLAGWPTTSREYFIKSDAYRLLHDELERHIAREINGRSFLIAGHRGAGKTMLVQAVIDDIRNDIFKEAEEQGRINKRVAIVQRPVLVRIYGPTLLGDPTAPAVDVAAKTPQQQPDPKASEAAAAKSNTSDASEGSAADTSEKKPPAPADPVQSALVQVTVALYRALSSEFATAFALAAQEGFAKGGGRSQLDRLAELPAQLRLELDSGAEVAMLRDFWMRADAIDAGRRSSSPSKYLGRLEAGILWPSVFLRESPDRGYLEIAALATAGQAFRKCTGIMSAAEHRSDRAERLAKIEAKSNPAFQEAANKLFALAAGTLVGLGTHGPKGVLAGLAAGLASLMTLSWSGSRTSRGTQTHDYSFLPDLSVQSLDRDLPLVIERIRSLGLAPVFVVDEIDKLEMPDEAIRSLMRRLKQLTTDYGFFCFLTDRDYYERLQNQLDRSVFPVEHTYFTHRILVSYQVHEIAAYLRLRISTTLPPSSSDYAREHLAALLLGRVVLHKSELNTTQLMRELTAFGAPGQGVSETVARLTTSEPYRLAVFLQLAIEHVMRSREISARVAEDLHFAQIAADALYMISRAWRDRDERIRIDEEAVRTHLLHRFRLDLSTRHHDKQVAQKEFSSMISPQEVTMFTGAIERVADLVSDFRRLRTSIDKPEEIDDEDRPLLALFDTPLQALLRKEAKGVYVFRWNIFGILEADATALPEAERVALRANNLLDLLKSAGPSVDELVGVRLLPDFTNATLEKAVNHLRAAASNDATYPEASTDIERLRAFCESFAQRGAAIGVVLHLVYIVREKTKSTASTALRALGRYLALAELAELSGDELLEEVYRCLPDARTLDLSVIGIGSNIESPTWKAAILGGQTRQETESAQEAWRRWFRRAKDLVEREPALGAASLQDVLFAARGELPGSIFRRDIAALSVAELSDLVLECVLVETSPSWGIPFGLWRLGFGRRVILDTAKRAGSELEKSSVEGGDVVAFADSLESRATADKPGSLAIMATAAEDDSGIPDPQHPPVLAVQEAAISRYLPALEWLQRSKAFEIIEDAEND